MSSADEFVVEVNFLTGRFVATHHNDRREPEWPPHPARLFSALVDAWADADEPDETERAALEWLEALGAPAITASDCVARTPVSHFVPVNDTAIISRAWYGRTAENVCEIAADREEALAAPGEPSTKTLARIDRAMAKVAAGVAKQTTEPGKTRPAAALALLPERRAKQERFFPSVSPDETRVTFVWNVRAPRAHVDTLDRLLGRVARLGHSSSLVSCRVGQGHRAPTYVPCDGFGGSLALRTVRSGQLAELEKQHLRHRGIEPRSLPFTSVSYTRASDDRSEPGHREQPNTHGEWVVFAFDGGSRTTPSQSTVVVAAALRGAILRYAEDRMPEELSGHSASGRPTAAPHVAFLPLPYVGFPHADGRLLGVAVSVPMAVSDMARRALLRAVGAWERAVREAALDLRLGTHGVLRLARVVGLPDSVSLRLSVWTGPSCRWASATPIALPRHPGPLRRGTAQARARAWTKAETAVVAACAHVGLPRPAEIQLSLAPFIRGAAAANAFPPFRQNGRDGPVQRQLVHASILFERPVSGPLMLGAGRFLGLGLMRPLGTRV